MVSQSKGCVETASIGLLRLGLNDVSPEVLGRLEQLYSHAFHNSHMFEGLVRDIGEQPEVFQLFIARPKDDPEGIVGARVIESKPHSGFDYQGHTPVHGKRFCVLPVARGQGIGRRFVEAGKRYCFDELGVEAIFGESNELGALSMHGREGALYSVASIQECSRRNGPDENLEFFREFLGNPRLRSYRFPVGPGVRFVYCKDDEIAAKFTADGYVSRELLLS